MSVLRRFFARTLLLALAAALALSGLSGCAKDQYQDALQAMLEKERLVDEVRLNLLLAVEAEKNAVLSSTEEATASYAASARKDMETARDNLARLTALVDQGREPKETQALAAVAADFGELQTVDVAILDMAGRNTNLRASRLSRTEAAQAASRFAQALAPIADGPSCPAALEALRAVTAGLSILSLHAQHIEESSNAGMDALEAAMDKHNSQVAAALGRLSGLLRPDAAKPLAEAEAAYADFWRVTQDILRLSRENTNINVLALVMGRKRLLTAKSLDDLAVLRDAVASRAFKATR